jgi:hypothetical protein
MSVFGDLADVGRWVAPIVSDANDPSRTSGRKFAVLHNRTVAVVGCGRPPTGARGETSRHQKP